MIDYQVLCQAIAEWKSGQRPPSGPHAAAGQPEEVEELGSGFVEEMEVEGGETEEAPAEYAEEAAYEEAAPAEEYEAAEEVPAEEGLEEVPVEEVPTEDAGEAVEGEEAGEEVELPVDEDDEIPVE